MHSAGLELTKVTYTRLKDNLIRHRGDRLIIIYVGCSSLLWGTGYQPMLRVHRSIYVRLHHGECSNTLEVDPSFGENGGPHHFGSALH